MINTISLQVWGGGGGERSSGKVPPSPALAQSTPHTTTTRVQVCLFFTTEKYREQRVQNSFVSRPLRCFPPHWICFTRHPFS